MHNDNKKERMVFLLGAGATMGWNSPSTYKLTQLVRESGFKTRDNKTTITEYLYQALINNGYSENDINFETIINLIEELIVYYSYFDVDKETLSLLNCLFSPKYKNFEYEILNFSIKGGEAKHGYELQIPAGKDYDLSKRAYHKETPNQFFLLHLLSNILSNISAEISRYAYHTSGHSVIDITSSFSKNVSQWMVDLSQDKILRIYTLNYERIFKILLERNGIPVFEGFDCDECIPMRSSLRANVSRILNDKDCHSHYNLHGSVYWQVFSLDQYQLPNPEIGLRAGPNLPSNHSPASFQVEKGKTLLVTNIITGYQKAQKIHITPYRQMHAAFDHDCFFADEIYIIGYSFGDEHINQCLKTALRYNKEVKITIVDPSFIKNRMDEKLALTLFTNRGLEDMKPTNVDESTLSYFDGAITVHTKTFEDFLNMLQSIPLLNHGEDRSHTV